MRRKKDFRMRGLKDIKTVKDIRTRRIKCSACNGTGLTETFLECRICGGRGYVRNPRV